MSRILILAAASAAMLAGCSILPKAEPVDIYRLGSPNAGGDAARPFGAPTVMISVPTASRTVGGNNVVVVQPDGAMALAAGAQWVAPVRNMVQDYLIETFEAQALQVSTLRPGDGIAGDYDLAIDLRNFEAAYDRGIESAPIVHVSAGARLINGARDLQGSTVATAEVRATTNRMAEIVAAFDQAMAEIAAELAVWTESSVAESERRIVIEEGGEPRQSNVDVDVDVDVD